MTEERPAGHDTDRERRESGRERTGRRHRHSGLFLGLVLIWLGVSFFLQNQGVIPAHDWWKYFVIGLGVTFIVDSWAQYGLSHAGLTRGRIVAGLILITVGAAFLMGGNWWPLVLIVVGLVILLKSLWRKE